ncbi:MAG TPA: dihydrofolate reductase [Candidatus Faecousia intestinigallinarum]|nr:dihydrofolate reductase [Candidatus Faecousia intestinigallinarum]
MDLIVAVYDHWGIGKDGTQPVALSADRKFFRETTRGAMVIVGRKTLADFPGGKPLPGRVNVVLTRQDLQLPGVRVCRNPEAAAELAKGAERAFVIGGGSVYREMLALCSRAYVTKVHIRPVCDTFFPDLDADPAWRMAQILQSGEENGVSYEICLYLRKK